MRPITILRIVMVCMIVFFLYAGIRKARKEADERNSHPSSVSQAQSSPPAQYQAKAQPARAVATPVRQQETLDTGTAPSDTPEPKQKIDPPAPKLTPATPSSGTVDILTVTLQRCHRSGEEIQCYGTVRNNMEIAQVVGLEDSHAIDDEGRTFQVFLFGGSLRFDTGQSQNLLPGIPVRFYAKIADPYPRVKMINLDLRMSIGAKYFPMLFKDYPVQ